MIRPNQKELLEDPILVVDTLFGTVDAINAHETSLAKLTERVEALEKRNEEYDKENIEIDRYNAEVDEMNSDIPPLGSDTQEPKASPEAENPNGTLKPCPFCGAAAEQVTTTQGWHYVRCRSCLYETPKYAVDFVPGNFWNRRPIEDELRAENEQLKRLTNKYERDLSRDTHVITKLYEKCHSLTRSEDETAADLTRANECLKRYEEVIQRLRQSARDAPHTDYVGHYVKAAHINHILAALDSDKE